MKHRLAFVLAAALAATLGSSAQAAHYPSVAIDKSRITFSYRQMGVVMDGRFKRFSAQLNLDTAKPEQATGAIEIDLASIDTGSSEADQEVLGKSWFNAAAYPKARFVLKELRPLGASDYEALGQLTIKGQTRELRAPLKLSPQGVLTGSFVLKRADFHIGEGVWAKFDVVANEIAVHLNLNLNLK